MLFVGAVYEGKDLHEALSTKSKNGKPLLRGILFCVLYARHFLYGRQQKRAARKGGRKVFFDNVVLKTTS